jgi:hypothetical protein
MRDLDHVAAMVNPFLIVIAIGLAAMNLTSFLVLIAKDALPSIPIMRISCSELTSLPLDTSHSETEEMLRRPFGISSVENISRDLFGSL